jgi:hypothetical protein
MRGPNPRGKVSEVRDPLIAGERRNIHARALRRPSHGDEDQQNQGYCTGRHESIANYQDPAKRKLQALARIQRFKEPAHDLEILVGAILIAKRQG